MPRGSHGVECTSSSALAADRSSLRCGRLASHAASTGSIAGAGPGALAVRAEEALLVIAEDHVRLALLEEAHDLVREAVFLDAVAEADQLVDVAHQRERLRQPGGVAMDVRDDADLHARDLIPIADFIGGEERQGWP